MPSVAEASAIALAVFGSSALIAAAIALASAPDRRAVRRGLLWCGTGWLVGVVTWGVVVANAPLGSWVPLREGSVPLWVPHTVAPVGQLAWPWADTQHALRPLFASPARHLVFATGTSVWTALVFAAGGLVARTRDPWMLLWLVAALCSPLTEAAFRSAPTPLMIAPWAALSPLAAQAARHTTGRPRAAWTACALFAGVAAMTLRREFALLLPAALLAIHLPEPDGPAPWRVRAQHGGLWLALALVAALAFDSVHLPEASLDVVSAIGGSPLGVWSHGAALIAAGLGGVGLGALLFAGQARAVLDDAGATPTAWTTAAVIGASVVAAHGRSVLVPGLYDTSGHEMLRYAVIVWPLLAVATVEVLAMWPARSRRLAALALALPPWPALLGPVGVAQPFGGLAGAAEGSMQAAARAIVARMETHPTCGVLVRADTHARDLRGEGRWLAVRPSPLGWHVVRAPAPTDDPREAARLLDGIPCGVAYAGIACARDPEDEACHALYELPAAGRENVQAPVPFVHPAHLPEPTGPVDLTPRAIPDLPPTADAG